MERLIIVRHGFPDHMERDQTGGWTDSHLTSLGRRQARPTGPRVAELLKGRDYAFYASDLSRTIETAEEMSTSLGLSPRITPALREQSLGEADNLTNAEAYRIALNPTEGPVVDRVFFPGSETWREMMQRVFGFLDDLAADDVDAAVLVSHAGASTCIVFWWLGIPLDRWPDVQFEFDLCSITELIIGDFGGRRVLRLNDVGHLERLRARGCAW